LLSRQFGGVGKFYIFQNSLLPFPDRKGDKILKGAGIKSMPLRTIKRQLSRRRKFGRRCDTESSQGLEQLTKMKTKNIIILTILTVGGLMMNPVAFSGQLPYRPLPAPPVRATPVPRSKVTPTPAPDPIAISYQTSAASNIALTVTVGQAGAPAGFSVQWITLDDYIALGNQWPETLDVPNPAAPSFCKAAFRSVVSQNCTGYNLSPGQKITITIGDDSLYDNCAVTSPCSGSPLLCNTAYVFRALAVDPTGQHDNIRVSETIRCATLPCAGGSSCTYSQGYWRNHPNAWPVTSLTLGTITYQAAELMAILDNPAQGNGLVILTHQLIVAKLNIANGADPSAVQQAITDADNMIGAMVVPPIGNGYLLPAQTRDLTETLTEYNEGTIGPGHCN
jgi:hypothetical protein